MFGFSLIIENKDGVGLAGVTVKVRYSGFFPGSIYETVTNNRGSAWIVKPTEYPLHVESITVNEKEFKYVFEAKNNQVKFFTLR